MLEAVWEWFLINLKHLFRKVIVFYFSLKNAVPYISVLYINTDILSKPAVCSLTHDGVSGGNAQLQPADVSQLWVFLKPSGFFACSAGLHLVAAVNLRTLQKQSIIQLKACRHVSKV